MKFLLSVVTGCLLLLAGCRPSTTDTSITGVKSHYYKALEVIQRSRERLNLIELRNQTNGIYLEGSGTFDLSTRMQGMKPGVTEPYPISEKLGVDLLTGRVGYESDTHVNPDAREWVRFIFDGQNRMLFAERNTGMAFWESHPELNNRSKRYSNMVPHMLLEEAYTNRNSLNYWGIDKEDNHLISFVSPSYGAVTLYINQITYYLTGVVYLKDMPLLGDTSIRWRYKTYQKVDSLGIYPMGYTVQMNGNLLKDINYTLIQPGMQKMPVFEVPSGIAIPQKPPPPTAGEGDEAPGEETVREPIMVRPGIYIFPHIRSGFHPMVIEFKDYLMVVDAPAGWYEMHQLPAMQWVEGASSSSTGRKLLNAIRQKFPEKPVGYVALTHFHSDHAGGIRPFIEAGATVLASAVTAPVVRQAVSNRFSLQPDELTGKTVKANIEIVDGHSSITDGAMEVHLVDVGSNPHAEGMLIVWLPKHKILYQSDLFEPTNMNYFPNKSRLPVMKWFVNWLDNSELDAEYIYSIHAGLRVTNEHLKVIRSLRN